MVPFDILLFMLSLALYFFQGALFKDKKVSNRHYITLSILSVMSSMYIMIKLAIICQ